MFGIPHVVTSHGNDVFGLKSGGVMGALKRFVLKHSDSITVNSSATRKAVLELGANAEKVHLIPAVANVGEVNPDLVDAIEKKYGKSHKVLFVGRFIEEKGVLDLLQAFAQVVEQLGEVQCLFAGDGVLRAEMEEMARDLKIEQAVHFVGWQPGNEIASWMAAADVLVVPSKPVGTWQEAQGLVVVEAMAVGTPVIASRIGGIPDMVEDGVTGRLFTAGGSKQLADLLLDRFSNQVDYQRMTQAAKVRVAEHYAPDAVVRQARELYRRVLQL
jgi:glycosyltransferase involved in cell wall biosynthesis